VRITALVVIAALAAWCLTLLDYGLSQLPRDPDKPGILSAVIVLPILIACLAWAGRRAWERRLF
jgi:hypothetical protein